MVCLRVCIVALLLLGTAQAQRFTTPEDTARADALPKQMTIQEKIGQLNQPFYAKLPIPGVKIDPVPYEERVRRSEVGSFLFLTDYKEINRLQKIAMTETRLHIPILFGFDVIHGFDTEFPVPLATAASWDPAMAEQAQAIAAEEASHAGLRWSFASMLDIARDPRWGRISEGAGEDPFLGAAMARAQVLGFQGAPQSPRPFMATLKHFANNKEDMNGPWSLTAKAEDTVSVFEGIRAKFPGSNVDYAEGVQIVKDFPSSFDGSLGHKLEQPWTTEEALRQKKMALDLAAHADVVIMTLGELSGMDFEYASRSSLALPGKQQEFIEQIQALGKPVVLLLFSTRPLDLLWASEHVPAIMDCYFGGTETGNAVADLLVGDAVPGGKLPVTWPRNEGQVPIYYAHTASHKPYDSPDFTSRYWDLSTSPLYPFGYGLSYSTFTLSGLRLSAKDISLDAPVTATVTLTNTAHGQRTKWFDYICINVSARRRDRCAN